MLDPKAKDTNGTASGPSSGGSGTKFPWSRREGGGGATARLTRGRSGSGGSVGSPSAGSPRRIVTKPPPPPQHTVHAVQMGAKAPEDGVKAEHRCVVGEAWAGRLVGA